MRLCRFLWLCVVLVSVAHAQWQLQQTRAISDLLSVSALSGQSAWVSGAEGTVLHTADGGTTWKLCPVPIGAEHLALQAIQAFNDSTALVMSSGKGDLSRIYRTSDGCQTWNLVMTNPDPQGEWRSMQFRWTPASASRAGYSSAGVLIGRAQEGEFPIYTSKDYGLTWRSLQEDEAYSPGPAAVAHEGELLLASSAALTTITEDNTFAFVTGGEGGARLVYPQSHTEEFNSVALRYSFADIRLPITAKPNAGGYAVASRRTNTGGIDLMVVGGDAANPTMGSAVLIRRTGLKKLFMPSATASVHPPRGLRTAVGFDTASNAWITVGPNGTDASNDDGRSWTPLLPLDAREADTDWSAMSLPFVVGPRGRIGKLRGITANSRIPASEMVRSSVTGSLSGAEMAAK